VPIDAAREPAQAGTGEFMAKHKASIVFNVICLAGLWCAGFWSIYQWIAFAAEHTDLINYRIVTVLAIRGLVPVATTTFIFVKWTLEMEKASVILSIVFLGVFVVPELLKIPLPFPASL
jgi:hypothetical protein